MNTTRLHLGLSDLFFNHTHDQYDAACCVNLLKEPEDRDQDSERFALREDAEEFCAELSAAYNINEDPELLVEDFFQRL